VLTWWYLSFSTISCGTSAALRCCWATVNWAFPCCTRRMSLAEPILSQLDNLVKHLAIFCNFSSQRLENFKMAPQGLELVVQSLRYLLILLRKYSFLEYWNYSTLTWESWILKILRKRRVLVKYFSDWATSSNPCGAFMKFSKLWLTITWRYSCDFIKTNDVLSHECRRRFFRSPWKQESYMRLTTCLTGLLSLRRFLIRRCRCLSIVSSFCRFSLRRHLFCR